MKSRGIFKMSPRIEPSDVRQSVAGQCLMSLVPKWKFPEFTGELKGDVTQEVINASIPLEFSP